MEPISVEENNGEVINISKEDSEQFTEQTFAASNNEPMQKSSELKSDSEETNIGLEMGSSESTCEKDKSNSEENSFVDCKSSVSNSELSNFATDEEGPAEKFAIDAVTCEAINETLVVESKSLLEDKILSSEDKCEVELTTVDGEDRRKKSLVHDFEMELIIKSLTANKQQEVAPNKTKKRTDTVTNAAEYSDEEDEEDVSESFIEETICRWPNCSVKKSEEEIVLHERLCEIKLCICKWPQCNREVVLKNLEEHEENCSRRLSSCTWWNCDEELLVEEIEDHVEKCGNTLFKCKWSECDQEVERKLLGNCIWGQ